MVESVIIIITIIKEIIRAIAYTPVGNKLCMRTNYSRTHIIGTCKEIVTYIPNMIEIFTL